jgi:hypothetical protein
MAPSVGLAVRLVELLEEEPVEESGPKGPVEL